MSIQPIRTYPSRRRLRNRNSLGVAQQPLVGANSCASGGDIDRAMRTIAAINGVTETYLVDRHGEIISSAMGTITEPSRSGAAVQLAQDALSLRTSPVAIHFEFSDHHSHIMPVSREVALIAFGTPDWNYGLVVREVRAGIELVRPFLLERPHKPSLPTRSSAQAAMRTANRMSKGASGQRANWKSADVHAPVLTLSTYADVLRGIRAIT